MRNGGGLLIDVRLQHQFVKDEPHLLLSGKRREGRRRGSIGVQSIRGRVGWSREVCTADTRADVAGASTGGRASTGLLGAG